MTEAKQNQIAVGMLVCALSIIMLIPAYFIVSDSSRREGQRLEIEIECRRVNGTSIRTEDGAVVCLKNGAAHWRR